MKKIFTLIITITLALSLFACGGTASNTDSEKEQEQDTAVVSIILDSTQAGDYGREITLNGDTEDAYTYYGFFLPAGTYTVTNNNQSGGCQVSVYMDETRIIDGWEEPVTDGCPQPIVLMAGGSAEISLEDGMYIKLADGDSNIAFTPVD